jgi:hypothetical protein
MNQQSPDFIWPSNSSFATLLKRCDCIEAVGGMREARGFNSKCSLILRSGFPATAGGLSTVKTDALAINALGLS